MLAFKYLLMILGAALFGSAGSLVVYDIFLSTQLRRLLRGKSTDQSGAEGAAHPPRPFGPVRWQLALKLAAAGILPVLLAYSFAVVPDGFAGVRVSQIWGARPGTLYPGLHLITPLVDSVELYDIREQTYSTIAAESTKQKGDVLTVQAREGLSIGLAVAVRYRIDARRLGAIHGNLPPDVGEQVVAPVVGTIYRSLAPNYITREIFATKREELRAKASEQITARLGADGIIVREVLLRDLKLPEEYAKGLEGLLLKEQENERLSTEQEIKQKEVRIAELEAEAQKSRDVKQAEAQAQVRVLQAKAESDSMQYTLPLKQKQIEQSKLEAAARKEATLQNADAAAQAKIIDSKAEIERQKNLSDAEANRIRVTAAAEADRERSLADAEANRIRVTAAADHDRMQFEAAVLKQNPMLIQKIVAERLSDKLQIIMVPVDGKNFFANDVLRSAFSGVGNNSASNGDSEEAGQAQTTTAARGRSPRKP